MDKLALDEARFRSAFEAAAVGLALILPNGRFLEVNQALVRFFGYSREELLARTFQSLTHPDDVAIDNQLIQSLLDGERSQYFREKRYINRQGEAVWASLGVSLLRDDDGQPLHLVSQVRDITERKRREEELRRKDEHIRYLAFHDQLTGLPNRFFIEEQLTERVARPDAATTLLFIDLDRFKNVNDILGHKAGDELLRQVARRIAAILPPDSTLARLGSDEFLVILPEQDEAAVGACAQAIMTCIAAPFIIAEQEINLSAGIGISVHPRDGEDHEGLLKNANTAMYRAKRNGGNAFQFFSPEMGAHTVELLKLENDLHRAIERHQLRIHYQPKVNVKSRRITGMEALIRWQHPERGLVSPGTFIPLAEETGLIIPIGEWVLRTACAQCKEWHDKDFGALRVAVNVSTRQFLLPNFAKCVENALTDTGLPGEYLELELTESILMHHSEETLETLRRLKTMGVHLSIDDFGTGYSNLNSLRQYNFDSLKIDRSFIQNIVSQDQQDSALAVSILNMAQNLLKQSVAEGVETQGQYDFLVGHNCDEIQGFFVSKPLPPDQFEQLLARTDIPL